MAKIRVPDPPPSPEPVPHLHGHGHPGRGHEKDDVSISGIVKFVGALLLGAFLVWAALAGMWRVLSQRNPTGPVVSPFAGPRELPPTPRLQVEGNDELQVYLDREAKRLRSYGESGKGSGVFHIPIDRAMDLVAQRGLPARQPSQQPKQPPRKQVLQGNERNPNEPKAQ